MSTIQIEGLWAYIQTLSLSNRNKEWLANRLIESKNESVSPSNDAWFDDKDNIQMLHKAIAESEQTPAQEYSIESLDKMLGYGI